MKEGSKTQGGTRNYREIKAGQEWNDPATRRQFLRCCGGATAATVVGWHAVQPLAWAQSGKSGGSGT